MSGTNNPYDPTEMYKKWLRQNEEFQDEFKKNFERVREQVSEISKLPETMQRFTEQVNRTADPVNQGAQQFADMVKAAMAPWQSMQAAEYAAIPNILVGWASFKTAIGSNGRISVPEAERSALGLHEGDLVQVIVLPVSKKKEVNQ